jgi:hypothetical protein
VEIVLDKKVPHGAVAVIVESPEENLEIGGCWFAVELKLASEQVAALGFRAQLICLEK